MAVFDFQHYVLPERTSLFSFGRSGKARKLRQMREQKKAATHDAPVQELQVTSKRGARYQGADPTSGFELTLHPLLSEACDSQNPIPAAQQVHLEKNHGSGSASTGGWTKRKVPQCDECRRHHCKCDRTNLCTCCKDKGIECLFLLKAGGRKADTARCDECRRLHYKCRVCKQKAKQKANLPQGIIQGEWYVSVTLSYIFLNNVYVLRFSIRFATIGNDRLETNFSQKVVKESGLTDGQYSYTADG